MNYKIAVQFINLIILVLFNQHLYSATEAHTIPNYSRYSTIFASSGQPSANNFTELKQSGVERVIYLAFNHNMTAIADEDRVVTELGMDYVHIPIDFNHPKLSQYQDFVAIMKQNTKNTLLHCQVNYRASTFSFLYRVIELNVPIAKAKNDLDRIWEPNPVWFKFIKTVLKHYSMNMNCSECDWGANEFAN